MILKFRLKLLKMNEVGTTEIQIKYKRKVCYRI